MMTATALDRYRQALASIPPPGAGCHPSLLSVANYGILAGRDPDQLFEDIRQAIPPGARHIPDKEIADAIRKALEDHQGATFTPRSRPEAIVKDGKAALRRIVEQARITTEVDLWEKSPIQLHSLPDDDPVLLLETLFTPDDLLLIGDRYADGIMGQTIRPAGDWLNYFRAGGATFPHIIPNPLDGILRPKKSDDGNSLRGDANVQAFRFAIVEFDGLPRDEQLKFWCAVKLPVVALIDSGGKSIHGWVDLAALGGVTSPEEWETEVKDKLFGRILVPLGVDSACSNASRLSRLPGHYRVEKEAYQRLLWLSPKGRTVA
jgi:hypothetical protein